MIMTGMLFKFVMISLFVDSIWLIKLRNHIQWQGNLCALLAILCCFRLFIDPGSIAENFSSSQNIYFDGIHNQFSLIQIRMF